MVLESDAIDLLEDPKRVQLLLEDLLHAVPVLDVIVPEPDPDFKSTTRDWERAALSFPASSSLPGFVDKPYSCNQLHILTEAVLSDGELNPELPHRVNLLLRQVIQQDLEFPALLVHLVLPRR